MTGYIPANPVVDGGSLPFREPLEFPRPGLFWTARHALVAYLRYLGRRGRPVRTMLLPDYICHEVVAALKSEGCFPRFYPLDEDWDAREEGIESLLREGAEAVLLAHFYGRVSRRLEAVSALCRRSGAVLIEDCVHLPFPHAPGPFLADARLYTLRKIYPVPGGAPIALREGQEEFAAFVHEELPGRLAPSPGGLLLWAAKQAGKKLLTMARVPWAQAYRDLSADPLPPSNFARPGLRRLIGRRSFDEAAAKRRRNYRFYAGERELLERWGRPLGFDSETDIPYMLPIVLRPGLDAGRELRRLFSLGVPASAGMALDREVLEALPNLHPFRRVLALPLHQSLGERHIGAILKAMRRCAPAPAGARAR